MEKRMILAIALSMGILVLWPKFFATTPVDKAKSSLNQEELKEASDKSNNLITEKKAAGIIANNNKELEKESSGVLSQSALETSIIEKTYKLSNEYLIIEFSSLAASIKNVTIINKDIKQAAKLDFFSSQDFKPIYLELVKNVNFNTVEESEQSISFTYSGSDAESIKITYAFDDEKSYLINISIQSTFNNDLRFRINLYQDLNLKDSTYGLPSDPLQRVREYVYFDNNKTERQSLLDFKTGASIILSNTLNWFAVADKYFTIALLNKDRLFKTAIDKNDIFSFTFSSNKKDLDFSIYAGPKDVRYLRPVESSLTNLIDFGWLSFISVPILELLKFLYSIFPNYGLAIMLLTLIVRSILYPLQHKSMKSMKKLQNLQPQIKALQEKHKDNKERMNKEVMQFMRTHKVNPMGGCFPMLLQLPVFFALYKVLGNAVELYQAPFILWIQDLAIKDPYYVLPALMGLMMFFQQKLTPNPSMDPMQAKMLLYIMPVMITVFMLNLPSGLTLYIMFSSMLGILQQYFINKSKV
jgi:YidC/Oxa1 family membrane protein insertase